MTGDPWQPPAPAGPRIDDTLHTALFRIVTHTVMMQPNSYTHAVVNAIISAGWRPPPEREPSGCTCPCHRPK
jgi:hypothetical protein